MPVIAIIGLLAAFACFLFYILGSNKGADDQKQQFNLERAQAATVVAATLLVDLSAAVNELYGKIDETAFANLEELIDQIEKNNKEIAKVTSTSLLYDATLRTFSEESKKVSK